jgi:phosphohistidine phosphatase
MKKLYLIRHAKSSWLEEGVDDFDRPLKGSGIRDAHNTSQWLFQQGFTPNLILSSPATRALHTALIFAKNLHYPYRSIKIKEAIYEAQLEDIFNTIHKIKDKHKSVLLFGHNPTITAFVNHCIDHIIDNVPTTGVACLKFDVEHWADIKTEAELLFFDFPKRRLTK